MSNCIIFEGYKDKSGYGRKRKGTKNCYAHRLAWMKHNNTEIPENKIVMHLCNNPSCVNPMHLMLGTRSDNTKMMYALGRHKRITKPKTHCPRGHELSGDNIKVNSQNARICVTCRRAAQRKYDAKIRLRKT